MREVKFRAWLPAENKMCEAEVLRPGVGAFLKGASPHEGFYDEENRVYYPPTDDGHFCELNEIVLVQYTGLEDKNGKEIYQSDIVKAIAKDDFSDDTGIHEVIFGADLQWQLRGNPEYNHGLPLAFGGWVSLEVIGNIYENPELLEAKS